MEGKLKFDFNSFLIGIVMVLISIIGFLTKAAYSDVKESLTSLNSTIVNIDKRVTTLETINSITILQRNTDYSEKVKK